MTNLPMSRQVRKDGKIRKLKRKQRFRVSKEDDDKLTLLAQSLSLQNGHVENSLRESLSGIHDMATGALTLNCEKHHSRIDETEKELTASVFNSPFTVDEVEMLRKDVDTLRKWDEKYFSQRKSLINELNDLVASVTNTDVEQCLVKAKDALTLAETSATEHIALLTEKLKECDLAEEKARKTFLATLDF